ncbi:MAG TPA: hypothetical protein VL147_12315 [Devosia sp.]|nr:hypothetical protein [Devosia sp.]
MTEADFASARWDHYSTELRIDEIERTLPDVSGSVAVRDSLQHPLRILRKHLGAVRLS